jgi:hypothetical protein
VRTIRQQLSGLARHMDIDTLMLRNSHMTLAQVLSLLPPIDQLRSALEDTLATVGQGEMEGTG